uniref:VWFA domain-containing protein n=1 Tax=Angiostrongylus cantonensis TaxID=6313 RepID=A0A158P5W5_ANGCA
MYKGDGLPPLESSVHQEFQQRRNLQQQHSEFQQVSLIKYSGPGRTETLFHLDKHKKKDNVIEELFNDETTGGTTRTGEAIRHAVKEFANPKHGARKNAQKFIVVFTDGYSQDDPSTAADEARRASITMLAVAINDARVPPNVEELAEITKNRNVSKVSEI